MARGAKRPVNGQQTLDDAGTPQEGFSGPQACDIVGISYRQLDYWASTDLVRPSLADAAGSGTQRRYSYRDLVRLKVIKSLLDAGVKLQSARAAIEYLREDGTEQWETVSIVLAGSDSVIVRSDGELIDIVRKGQTVLNLVPMAFVVGELDAKIHELYPEVDTRAASTARRAAEGG
jgi:DNA-binding transcriptional MerR regulator